MRSTARFGVGLAVTALFMAGCETETKPDVPQVPDIAISVSELVLTDGDPSGTLTITPDGPGTVTWQVTSIPDWLTVTPRKATITDGEPDGVTLTADHSALPAQVHEAGLVIQYTGDRQTGVDVRFVVGSTPLMDVSVSAVTLDHFETSTTFTVSNLGNTPFSFDASSSAPYVTVTPRTGMVPFRGAVDVTVRAVRDGLDSGTHFATVSIDTDFGATSSVAVALDHYREPFTRLDYQVLDAEYDAVNDRIVTVSEDPGRLTVIDPVSGSVSHVELPGRPPCLALSRQGDRAVVGHSGLVSVVNLNTLTLEATHNVSANAHDIVLGPNRWAYVFPASSQWQTIRCLDLTTGEETEHTGFPISENMNARLHPSGNYIYAADTGISPSDFHKVDIRPGTANYLYDSAYHGDFAFSGNIWFSEDGLLAYARSGNVFALSEIREDDMIYRGALDGVDEVAWLAHSSAAGRVVVIPSEDGTAAPELRFYDPQFLLYKGSVTLWSFKELGGAGSGAFYGSRGRYVWIDATGSRVHVLVAADAAAGIENGWAACSYSIGQMP